MGDERSSGTNFTHSGDGVGSELPRNIKTPYKWHNNMNIGTNSLPRTVVRWSMFEKTTCNRKNSTSSSFKDKS